MTGNRKVLVIDDDDDFRSSVKALLGDEGYDVVEAADGWRRRTSASEPSAAR